MGFSAVDFEAAYGKIVHANGLNLALRQIMGSVFRDVHEPFLEIVVLPVMLGIFGLEKHSLAFFQLMGLELLHFE